MVCRKALTVPSEPHTYAKWEESRLKVEGGDLSVLSAPFCQEIESEEANIFHNILIINRLQKYS